MSWLSEEDIAGADLRYSDDQPRDEGGKWSSGGGGGGGSAPGPKLKMDFKLGAGGKPKVGMDFSHEPSHAPRAYDGTPMGSKAEHNASANKVGMPVRRYAGHLSPGEHVAHGMDQPAPTHVVLGARDHYERGAVGQMNLHLKDLKTGKESHSTHGVYDQFTSFPGGSRAAVAHGELRYNDAAKIAAAEPDQSSGSALIAATDPITVPGDVNGNFNQMSPMEQAQHMADEHGYLLEHAQAQGQYLAGLHAREHLAATPTHKHQ